MTDQPAKRAKQQKPQVFDDKSKALSCLTLIVFGCLATVVAMFVLTPDNYGSDEVPRSATMEAVAMALVNIISGSTGGIVGIVTGSKWAVGAQDGAPPVTTDRRAS